MGFTPAAGECCSGVKAIIKDGGLKGETCSAEEEEKGEAVSGKVQ